MKYLLNVTVKIKIKIHFYCKISYTVQTKILTYLMKALFNHIKLSVIIVKQGQSSNVSRPSLDIL